MIRPRSSRRAGVVLVFAMLAAAVAVATLATAQTLPALDLDPAPSADLLRPDLAASARDATLWLFEEEDDDAMTVWVWRVPGDPDAATLFADNAWADEPDLMRRDLGEALRATVEVFGPFFEARAPGWSDRALALAQRLDGVEQTQRTFTVFMPDDTMYGVQVSDRTVDLDALEVLEGTWVQVTLIRP